jgi:hypothetical protein
MVGDQLAKHRIRMLDIPQITGAIELVHPGGG